MILNQRRIVKLNIAHGLTRKFLCNFNPKCNNLKNFIFHIDLLCLDIKIYRRLIKK